MRKRQIRVLISGAGSGASGNLIRALRSLSPRPHVVGVNDDHFALKLSLAERNYLCPKPGSDGFVGAMLEVVRRERINVVIPTDDHVVKALSDKRARFPFDLFLPKRDTIDLCQDKYSLNVFLRGQGIPAPETYPVTSLRSLDNIFARFSRRGVLWCRARHGARALAATPVANAEQARAWITQWRDLQGVKVSSFTLGEYLPGRHFIIHSVWRDGSLLRAQPVEVLGYFAAGNNPSGIFSLSCLAKTVVAPEALQVALDTVRAIERRPSGAFSVELKESASGIPSVTEINAGRFPAGIAALLAVGVDNMVDVFTSTVVGAPIAVAYPHGSPDEYYLVRDIDAAPAIFSAADILKGVRTVDIPRRPRKKT